MATRAPSAAPPPPFDVEALRQVRNTLGAVSREDGEPFTFAPDVDAVVSWLAGGVPFQIPLGASREVLGDLLGDLVDDHCDILGSEQRSADPLTFPDPHALDVNGYFNHQLSVGVRDDVIFGVTYRLRAWSYSDDPMAMHMAARTGYAGEDGVVRAAHDNARFRAILERALPAAGFPLKAAPARAGKKARKGNDNVQAKWSRNRMESVFDALELEVWAWRA